MNVLKDKKIVLLEGTRKVPNENKEKLTEFAKKIATEFPHIIFRSGNASGSDELFAKGIEAVDPIRMQQVLPYKNANKKRLHKKSPVISLDDLTREEIIELADLSIEATPSYKTLMNCYTDKMLVNKFTVKARYLLRDALKVTGIKRLNFEPADLGIFYTSIDKPTVGGTGHTIRMCELRKIPLITQKEWM